ncbi:hypothetical protein [Microbispora triticiradicis]|uniref:hypothetical protein n=1 Tax=Microbispora triticiradicis TaxID=2200763 RepID=UPI0010591120|nr:hypothetical protein [Microbispora triticiradicis]
MTDDRSVHDKALKLQSEVRRLDLGRKDIQQAQRIAERVHTLRAALGDLRSKVTVARTLERRTGIRVDLSGLDSGRTELARKAAGGLPSDNSFNAASRKIKEATEQISKEILEQWRNWTEDQLELLPTNRISMLERSRQEAARSTLKNLRNNARSPRIATSDINLFVTQYEGLKDELTQTPDAPEDLLQLLARLNATTLSLQDVSDDEIALLRQYSMDSEVELRRRGL